MHPYLLRGVVGTRPDQVWSTDIAYIRLARGFVSLVAVIDWYSRKVLTWRLSNTLDHGFCVESLERAVQIYGTPEIFNADQGCQFTSRRSPGCSRRTALPSAWMGVGGPWITTLWNGSGGASRTKTSI